MPKAYNNMNISLRPEQTWVEHLLGLPTNIRLLLVWDKKGKHSSLFLEHLGGVPVCPYPQI
jgi:hypothetical protein